MTTIKVISCNAFEVGGDAPEDSFYVEAVIEHPVRTATHRPTGFAFYTREEAEAFALEVFLAGELESSEWVTPRGRPLN